MHRTLYLLLAVGFILCSCHAQGKLKSQKEIRVAISDDPTTADMRLARTLIDATVGYLLYDGLMRVDFTEQPKPAIATHYTLSEDGLTYTFHLRKALWSNGDPVTAEDFAETWKSIVDPAFPSPNVDQFYVIKNARAINQGLLPVDVLGVETPDPQHLVVHLEQRVPYFLQLVATFFYMPIHKSVRNREEGFAERWVGNGPYKLVQWKRNDEFTVERNPHYWDSKRVLMDGVALIHTNNEVSLQLFEKKQLDWAGSPLGSLPIDSISRLQQAGVLRAKVSSGTHFIRVNTRHSLLSQKKFRQALSQAIDRKGLAEYVLLGNQKPAFSLLSTLKLESIPDDLDFNIAEAKALVDKATAEANLSEKEMPTLRFCYGNSAERNHKAAQAIAQQWEETLGIKIALEPCEIKSMNQKVKNSQYDLAMGSFYADFDDPVSILAVFSTRDNGMNHTGWENPEYQRILTLSNKTAEADERRALLRNAEQILLNDMPVIPLWYNTFNYVKRDTLTGIYFSKLGYLDFKQASFMDYVTEPMLLE